MRTKKENRQLKRRKEYVEAEWFLKVSVETTVQESPISSLLSAELTAAFYVFVIIISDLLKAL